MALRIGDYKMSSSRSRHTARLAPGRQYAWEVSWLPGRHLNRDEAVTAMVLADATAGGDVRPGHQTWPHLQGWAAELGMTAPQALGRVAEPPARAPAASGPRTVSLDPDPVVAGWIEDPDPIDLGWADDPDWPEPDYPDPSWPGFGRGLRPAPAYLSDLAVSDWHAERHPDNPADPSHALRPGRDPRPGPGPGKLAYREAGQ